MKFPVANVLLLLETLARDVKRNPIIVRVRDQDFRLRTPKGMAVGAQ